MTSGSSAGLASPSRVGAVWATRVGDGGPEPPPGSEPQPGSGSDAANCAAARAFRVLLRATALSGGGGWRAALYAILIFCLNTIAFCDFAWHQFSSGIEMLAEGGNPVTTATGTGFFGVTFFVMWGTLLASFAVGRRRYGALLATLSDLMGGLRVLPGYQETARGLRRRLICLLVVTVGLTVLFTWLVVMLIMHPPSAPFLPPPGVWHAVKHLALGSALICFHLVPLKFAFVALQLTGGLRAVRAELESLVSGRRPPTVAALRQLRTLQDDLSGAFARLTEAMTPELVLAMTYGTLATVSCCLMVFVGVETGISAFLFGIFVLCLGGAVIPLLLPCEVTQRALTELGRSRDLLLKPVWSRADLTSDLSDLRSDLASDLPDLRSDLTSDLPDLRSDLRHELAEFRETVARDLDSLGDLGMFRLQRATVLSIMTTIITYIIILVQFRLV